MELTSYGPPSDAISFTTPQLGKRTALSPHSFTDTMHLTTCVPYTATPLPPLLLLMTVDFPPASGIPPLFSELTDTSVTISFQPLVGVVTVYVVEYHLERLTGGSARQVEVLPTNEGLISTTIGSLAPDSPYLFRYFSRNELGDSAPSPYLRVATGTQLQIHMCDTRTHAYTDTCSAHRHAPVWCHGWC